MAEPAHVYDEADEQPVTGPNLHVLEGGGQTTEPRRGHLQAAPDDPNASGLDQAAKDHIRGGGLFRDDDKQTAGGILSAAERAAGKHSSNEQPWSVGNNFKKLKKTLLADRKRKAGVGLAALLATGVLALFGVASGPGQVIQASEVLQREYTPMNNAASSRIENLVRFSPGARDIGETRLNVVGRQILRKSLDNLRGIGIDLQANSTGGLKSMTIDPEKLAEQPQYSELKTMTTAEQQAHLADIFNLSRNQLNFSDGTFSVNANDFPLKAASALTKDSIKMLSNGKIITGLQSRVLTDYFDQPSLFSPIKKITSTARQKLTSVAEQRAAEQQRVQEEITNPVETNTAGLRADLKSKLGDTFDGQVGNTLVATYTLCSIRSAADDAAKYDHEAIEVPAGLEAVDLVSVGEEIKDGRNVSAEQVGGIVSGFTDSKGQSFFSGKAFQALSGEHPSGPDLPSQYAQAFSSKTTADNIRNGVKLSVAGVSVTGVACSKAGLAVQGLASIVQFIANIPDGETLGFAAYAGEHAATAAAVGGVTYFFQHEFINLVKDKAVVPSLLSGPLGGNLAAYGARTAANIGAAASGGVALSSSATQALAYQAQQQSDQQFRSESLFARVFNVDDYRSLAGKLAQSVKPGLFANLSTGLSATMHVGGNLLSNLSSILVPRSSAADSYNWGFPLYGIPPDVLSNASLKNPYQNAETVANVLDGSQGPGLIQRASTCWGVTINKDGNGDWDVTPGNPVNTHDDGYVGADCANMSDFNWERLMMFVFDTRTAQAAACFQGDDTSCTEVGADTSGGSSSDQQTAPTQVAGTTIDMKTLYDSSTDIQCPANTKDLGIQDGYTDGNAVKIRICAVSNLTSSGEEANNGYGVTGADGKCVLNARVAGVVYQMVQAAKQDGVTLATNSCFRTMAHQKSLWVQDGENPVKVAPPGFSNHQMGLAIDFSTLPSTPGPVSGNPVWDWLSKNASKFGYNNYPAEAWHWSPTGN